MPPILFRQFRRAEVEYNDDRLGPDAFKDPIIIASYAFVASVWLFVVIPLFAHAIIVFKKARSPRLRFIYIHLFASLALFVYLPVPPVMEYFIIMDMHPYVVNYAAMNIIRTILLASVVSTFYAVLFSRISLFIGTDSGRISLRFAVYFGAFIAAMLIIGGTILSISSVALNGGHDSVLSTYSMLPGIVYAIIVETFAMIFMFRACVRKFDMYKTVGTVGSRAVALVVSPPDSTTRSGGEVNKSRWRWLGTSQKSTNVPAYLYPEATWRAPLSQESAHSATGTLAPPRLNNSADVSSHAHFAKSNSASPLLNAQSSREDLRNVNTLSQSQSSPPVQPWQIVRPPYWEEPIDPNTLSYRIAALSKWLSGNAREIVSVNDENEVTRRIMLAVMAVMITTDVTVMSVFTCVFYSNTCTENETGIEMISHGFIGLHFAVSAYFFRFVTRAYAGYRRPGALITNQTTTQQQQQSQQQVPDSRPNTPLPQIEIGNISRHAMAMISTPVAASSPASTIVGTPLPSSLLQKRVSEPYLSGQNTVKSSASSSGSRYK
ncbi:hypothetical protein BJ742DRAFT_860976 [Cladochytrium replicatum]|nr:hypothetical protein BJ742DRAFT_860976 [Cladochytrium replicatum]